GVTTDDTDNVGIGSFISTITGLTVDTTYYFRAYATNSEGTAYYPNTGNITYPDGHVVYVTSVKEPELTTGMPEDVTITISTALSNSSVDRTGGAAVTDRGVCWSRTVNPPTTDSNDGITHDNTNGLAGAFTSNLSNLTPDTTYYVRAYATNGAGLTGYGDNQAFRTLELLPPDVETVAADIDDTLPQSSAVMEGNVVTDGNAGITVRGAVWSTLPDPNLTDNFDSFTTEITSALGSFEAEITGLESETTYYVRAYATNSMGKTGYGASPGWIIETAAIAAPDVATSPADPVYQRTATAGGRVDMTGGADITARGVCWSTDLLPDTDDPCTTDDESNTGINTEPYVSEISGLTHSKLYYVRAYATNSEGLTGYGNQEEFITMVAGNPMVTTNAETSEVLSTSAIVGGEVLSDGGADLISKGICWNPTAFDTDADKDSLEGCSSEGTAIGIFADTLTGLSFDTFYYARAYAANGLGTAFGETYVTFTTLPARKPTVTLAQSHASIITGTTQQAALFIARVTEDGDAPVTKKGFVWNTSGLPIVESGYDDSTDNGDGIGVFEGSTPVGQLESGKTYYVRAYATNAVGTSYGTQEQFSLQSAPTVKTGQATAITSSAATITDSNVQSGGNNVTAKGVCWATSSNPTLANAHTTDGEGEGFFTSQIAELSPKTTYYVKAYATNSIGTSYGDEVSFTTVVDVAEGDVDGDGDVDLQDAIMALKVLAGLNPSGVYVGADVNGDGRIGIEEVIFILRAVMGT
ncbi:MAG: hypothetical protein GY749_35370, partial [Desulfobacteraceae bacterium]|nr:hypothetical protein [Desulfobacteraceae bacterium]